MPTMPIMCFRFRSHSPVVKSISGASSQSASRTGYESSLKYNAFILWAVMKSISRLAFSKAAALYESSKILLLYPKMAPNRLDDASKKACSLWVLDRISSARLRVMPFNDAKATLYVNGSQVISGIFQMPLQAHLLW